MQRIVGTPPVSAHKTTCVKETLPLKHQVEISDADSVDDELFEVFSGNRRQEKKSLSFPPGSSNSQELENKRNNSLEYPLTSLECEGSNSSTESVKVIVETKGLVFSPSSDTTLIGSTYSNGMASSYQVHNIGELTKKVFIEPLKRC